MQNWEQDLGTGIRGIAEPAALIFCVTNRPVGRYFYRRWQLSIRIWFPMAVPQASRLIRFVQSKTWPDNV